MRSFVLIAAAPLALAACGPDGAGNNSTSSNTAGPVPDEITVNGVVYVRADRDKIPAPVSSPSSASPSSLFSSSPKPDTGGSSSPPPNTDSGSSVAADHGE